MKTPISHPLRKILAVAATFSSFASVLPLASAAITPPSEATLIFSTDTDSLPADGAPAGTWANYLPSGGPAFGPMGAPTVKVLGGVKWVENHRSSGDGFDRGIFSSIATSGASIVVAFKPTRGEAGDWQSLVDIGTMGLVVGVRNDSGAIVVFRKGTRYLYGGAAAIPDGQTTILSCIFQENGPFKIFANGVEIVNNTSTSDPNLPLNPIVPWYNGAQSNNWASHINLGRTNGAGWASENGYIGDVFVYTSALSDTDRMQLEADLTAKFGGVADPFEAWINSAAFNTPTPLTAEQKLPGADPDGDGMSNQQEFAFGLDPTKGSSVNPITVPLSKATHKFSYTRLSTSGLTYTVWTSTDLATWAPAAVTESLGTLVDGVRTLEVTLTAPPAGDKLFVRVQAQ